MPYFLRMRNLGPETLIWQLQQRLPTPEAAVQRASRLQTSFGDLGILQFLLETFKPFHHPAQAVTSSNKGFVQVFLRAQATDHLQTSGRPDGIL